MIFMIEVVNFIFPEEMHNTEFLEKECIIIKYISVGIWLFLAT